MAYPLVPGDFVSEPFHLGRYSWRLIKFMAPSGQWALRYEWCREDEEDNWMPQTEYPTFSSKHRRSGLPRELRYLREREREQLYGESVLAQEAA